MKKTLYIVRHAHAEDLGNVRMFKDFDRRLTSKGIMQSAKLGQYFKTQKISIDFYLSSPAVRAFETAKVILEQFGKDQSLIQTDENLYGGGPKSYLAGINSISSAVSSAAIFGHNPDITFFAEYLTRDDIQGSMKKASVIQLEFEGLEWNEISGNTGSLVNRIDVADLN
ncbi:SixA phosphatase family protein [Jiulongibacter sediminis]|uniref:Phosphohistidine phosphatase n=1 Tax=Jiulongibacter sediminis TaxID=1605367 RepID=A0A0P7BW25_9BACT|nr:histidine phosphatase family protein [Jiulongibacter sediminis]KPM48874.1 phosphohistidine phosphatase [Jiulongibacter sediminis]TBX25405.1 phosphohistidine phosphatase [Jiulongibacter sediminis]